MKKALKSIGIIFVVLAVIAGSLAYWQRENIKSVYIGLTESAQQIENRRVKNQEKLVKDVNTYLDVPVREMTDEEKERIASGEAAASDIYAEIFKENAQSIETVPPSDKEGSIGTQSKGVDKKAKDIIVSLHMSKLYVLQSEFTARAESTISQGADYYESIKAHPQDAEARAKTITHFTPVVRGIEAECDGKVAKVISDLEKELKAIGADTDIVGTIKTAYKNEKQLKLSYYSNKYLT